MARIVEALKNSQDVSSIPSDIEDMEEQVDGHTLLERACHAANEDLAILCLQHGAIPIQNMGKGQNCLHIAAQEGWTDFLREAKEKNGILV